MNTESTRRKFVATTTIATAATALSTKAATPKTDVWVIHGKDKTKLMNAALKIISKNGGLCASSGTLALKVNAAWSRTPEQAGNTHPELIDAFIAGTKENVKKIIVPEHPCNRADSAFKRSGIADACKKHKIKMIDLKKNKKSYRDIKIPNGKVLTDVKVAGEYLDADCIVNMPVAKHHSGPKLSIAIKNWMGIIEDRREWHRLGLPQCIVDFATFIQPKVQWTMIDATRCMLDNGPQGPTENMIFPDLLIVSKDQVAADTYAATLFHKDPFTVEYLNLAKEQGVGQTDFEQMNIHKLEA